MSRMFQRWLALGLTGMLAMAGAPARAQPAGARPIEQGVGDAGPLATPGRTVPTDLRKPLGFERVYTLGRVDAFKDDEVFLRVSGGITAVFPRSVYQMSKAGARPMIPAGTVFYIGDLPEQFTVREPPATRSALAADLGVNLAASKAVPPAAAPVKPSARPQPGPAPSIWENEAYRGTRIGQVLRRARASEGSRPVGGP